MPSIEVPLIRPTAIQVPTESGMARRARKQRIDVVCDRCGLEKVRRRVIGRLSKGNRQRVGLAQALIGDPPVLILDEPTAGLDPHQIVEIRRLVQELRGEKTVLLSSHILAEVAQVCDRVIILDRGRLVGEEGGPGLKGGGTASTVHLSWAGDRDAVVRALADVVGPDAVTATAGGAEVFIAGNAVEVKPQLVESVLKAGGRLQGMEERGPTLEDLFMRLTGVMPTPDPAATAVTPQSQEDDA